ncbi:MAG: DMT family transporter [Actinobacteria bacterium]|nr:DMT family transporter [Actinomycetota bacterium]
MAAAVVALCSATAYALASVLQQRAAAAQPAALSMRTGLLVRLATRPLWLLGFLADVGGYALQFVALGLGSLALVQPLLVSGLLIALPLSAWLSNRDLRRTEWAGAVALVVGLGAFLVVAHPASGTDDASRRAWIAVALATLVPAGVLVGVGAAREGAPRARALATATGLLYGFTAALTKTSAHLLSLGIGHALAAWQPYALLVCGVLGMLLAQSAFQAAPLDASLPLLTVVDPLASVLIGAFAFHEAMANSLFAIVVELAAIALLAVGVFRVSAPAQVGKRWSTLSTQHRVD